METRVIKKVRAFILRDGKIAIMQFNDTGTFMLPGGKLEGEENIEQALFREILEETGIKIEPDNLISDFHQQIFERDKQDENGEQYRSKIITTFYLVKTNEDFNIKKMKLSKKEEQNGVKPYWINPEILEYKVNTAINKYRNEYFGRYAKEYLTAFNRFKEFEKGNNRELEK